MTKKIAIQGYAASFHDVAARQFFGQDIEIVPSDLPFTKVFDALDDRQADFAVCAIENSLYGTINEVYDLLLARRPWIFGEVYLRIEQCLIGLPGTSLEHIKEVHSHPVALAQCEQFIADKLPNAQKFAADDTAGSVALIGQWKNPSKAAIASAHAAERYGMQILARSIETNHQNYTRFAVLAREQQDYTQANKTSIVLELPHQAGSLHTALGAFAQYGINLSLLCSRPAIGQPGNYMFYIDFEKGLESRQTQQTFEKIKQMGGVITILGSFQRASWG